MTTMTIITTILAGSAALIAAILFHALMRQTKRADRAEAALSRVENEITNFPVLR